MQHITAFNSICIRKHIIIKVLICSRDCIFLIILYSHPPTKSLLCWRYLKALLIALFEWYFFQFEISLITTSPVLQRSDLPTNCTLTFDRSNWSKVSYHKTYSMDSYSASIFSCDDLCKFLCALRIVSLVHKSFIFSSYIPLSDFSFIMIL